MTPSATLVHLLTDKTICTMIAVLLNERVYGIDNTICSCLFSVVFCPVSIFPMGQAVDVAITDFYFGWRVFSDRVQLRSTGRLAL